MSAEFSVGEFVVRRMDGKVGQIMKAEPYDGDWLFYVDFSAFDHREEGGLWAGITSAWSRYFVLHAHTENESQDCDGKYTSGYVLEMTTQERCDRMGDLHFKDRVLSGTVSLHGTGTLTVTPEGFEWSEQTEEGYRDTEVRWCEDPSCEDTPSWQRDHRAEEMGY